MKIAGGGDGGGDPLIQEQMFARQTRKEKRERNAGQEQGIASDIIGIAANKSIQTGKPVSVASLINFDKKAAKLSDLT